MADPSFKRPVSSRTSFGVHHYAGEVVYTALGFCEKNKDTRQPALIELLASSQSDFVRSLVPYEHQASEQTRRKSTLLMDTLTAQFKMQLNKLVFVINSTSPHYVRCVNPNSEKTAGKIDRPCVLLQVQRPTRNVQHSTSNNAEHATCNTQREGGEDRPGRVCCCCSCAREACSKPCA